MSEDRSEPPADPTDRILWTYAVLSLVALVALSLGPAPAGLHAFPEADKLWHALGYGGVTFLWLLAGVWRPGRGEGRFATATMWLVAGFAFLGALIEIVQHWVDRAADPLDWLADLAGMALALALWGVLRNRTEANA